ncbi:MAG: hypothetical protein PCFJNLEI_03320 [Verrucomicrobiae bacterium]|nr:hypothetical protein [Verrucomicrobiae bacterium]
MYTTLMEAFWYVVDLLRKHPRQRKLVLILAISAISVALFAGVASAWQLIPQIAHDNLDAVTGVFAFLGIVALLASLSAYLPEEAIPPFIYSKQIKELRKEREEIKERTAGKPEADLFDTVQLSLNEIREYCVLNKRQAWSSFGFGVFAILLGLGTLLFGVWKFYTSPSGNLTVASLVSISGLLVQFIGGSSMYMYQTTQKQGNFYFASLVQMQDIMLSIRLCTETADQGKRAMLQEKVIETLLRRATVPLPQPMQKEK